MRREAPTGADGTGVLEATGYIAPPSDLSAAGPQGGAWNAVRLTLDLAARGVRPEHPADSSVE